jgi:phasin family protein
MSNFAPEQLAAAQKVGVETLFGASSKAIDGFEKLAVLNLGVVKSALAENREVVSKALSAKDLQNLSALKASCTQSMTNIVQQYGRKVFEIVPDMHADFATAAEAQLQRHYRKTEEFVDRLAKDAPAERKSAIAAWKALITATKEATSATYKATRQALNLAVKLAGTNASAVSSATAEHTQLTVVPVEPDESQ